METSVICPECGGVVQQGHLHKCVNLGHFNRELTGWVCPKCGRCYSPYMQECPYCVPNAYYVATGTDKSK